MDCVKGNHAKVGEHMILSASQLRKEIKDEFPSLKSVFCEYIECLDESYFVPPHQEAIDLLNQYWEPIKRIPWTRNIGDCDNRAIKLYSDVHWHRVLNMEQIPEAERIQWALGFASGTNPFSNIHTFNLIRTDQGLFIFDNVMKASDGYEPLTVRF